MSTLTRRSGQTAQQARIIQQQTFILACRKRGIPLKNDRRISRYSSSHRRRHRRRDHPLLCFSQSLAVTYTIFLLLAYSIVAIRKPYGFQPPSLLLVVLPGLLAAALLLSVIYHRLGIKRAETITVGEQP